MSGCGMLGLPEWPALCLAGRLGLTVTKQGWRRRIAVNVEFHWTALRLMGLDVRIQGNKHVLCSKQNQRIFES